jgi:hypothetical protein
MTLLECEWWLEFWVFGPWLVMLGCFFWFNPNAIYNIYSVFSPERYKTVFFFLLIQLYPFLFIVFFGRISKAVCPV